MSDLAGTYTAISPPLKPGVKGATADFGGGFFAYYFEEEVTLNTGGVTTTSGIVLPVGSLVASVSARITETITTAVNWAIGVTGDTTKFIPTDTTLTAGYTTVNQDSFDPTGAALLNGPMVTTSADTILVTTNAGVGAGKIRIGVGGFAFKPFTS